MKKSERLLSLDAIRGFDMLFIMGLSGLIVSICSLFPEGDTCWLAQTMKHVPWDGLAHHDTIFPLFLFIAGISFPFSFAKQKASGMSHIQIYTKIIKRAFLLVLLGMVYNGLFNLDFENLRYPSVLGRIGLAWMFAAILYINFKTRSRVIIATAILLGYWLLLRFVPASDAPAGASPFSLEGNLVGYIDRIIISGSHLYSGTFDPEGLLSTLPAIVTAMLGMFTGELVRIPEEKISGSRKALYMFGAAVVCLGLGLLWSIVFPINKSLWSSSFVLVVAAYSLALFSLFYYIIDVKKIQKWTFPLKVVGLNSITIYMAQRIVSFSDIEEFFLGGLEKALPGGFPTVVNGIGYILVCWLFLYFLYKHKVFLKI